MLHSTELNTFGMTNIIYRGLLCRKCLLKVHENEEQRVGFLVRLIKLKNVPLFFKCSMNACIPYF